MHLNLSQNLYFKDPETLAEGPIREKVLKKTEKIQNNLLITVFKPLKEEKYNKDGIMAV